jgi:hypothetical protein
MSQLRLVGVSSGRQWRGFPGVIAALSTLLRRMVDAMQRQVVVRCLMMHAPWAGAKQSADFAS